MKSFSQEPVFRHFTTMDGLPSSETYCAIQDEKGYMWIGTDRGLARFNGYEFKVFSAGQAGLRDNTIFGLTMDHRKRIWYLSYSGTIGYLFGDSFHVYPYNHIIKSTFKSHRMEGISIDRNGGFMTVTGNPDLTNTPLYINDKGKVMSIDTNSVLGFKDIYFSANNSSVTVGSMNARNTRIISQETGKVLCSFPSLKCKDMAMSSFVCRRKNGDLLVYHASEVFLVNGSGVKKMFECKGRALSMMLDRNEDLWIGYLNKGLEVYKARDAYFNPSDFNSLSKYSISGMTQDREGGLWFTTLEDGVFYLPPDFIFSYGKTSGLPVPKVMKIVSTDKRLMFVLSDHSVAYKHVDSYRINIPRDKLWKDISDMAYTQKGEIYFASVNGYKINEGSTWRQVLVKKIHIGHYDIWGYIAAELVKMTPGTNRRISISMEHIAKITSILEIGKDEVLIGTLDGLYIYKSGSIISLKSYHPFFQQRISSIIELDRNHLAFATIGHGIVIVRKDGYTHPIKYTQVNGLPSNMCNVLIRENDSTLIVGTNNGICRISPVFNPEQTKFYTADMHNGLISNEINDIKLIGNDLWIGTVNGLSILPLGHLVEKQNTIFLNMEQVRVANKIVNEKMWGEFPHDMNNMHFTFTGINYQYAFKLVYKYRLIGSDDRWNFSSDRTVIYNALSPGDYVFEVYVIGTNGKESQSKIRYAFSILPPFWKTWWFVFLSCLLIACCIYSLIARRIHLIREKVQVQNDLNVFRDKALRSQMNPHFIYNSINAIQNYIMKNETDASIDYLSLFSRLMRTIFNNSGEKTITLDKDLKAVILYAEMENMRFSDRFKLHISYDEQVMPSLILVPPFLIQPFVENAILHGLRAKVDTGNIYIHIGKEPDRIKISITDDGVGRKETLEVGKRKQAYLVNEDRSSTGIKVTLKRIKQVWGRRFSEDMFCITDLYTSDKMPEGTLIEFYLPLINYD